MPPKGTDNQVPPLADRDLLADDPALTATLPRLGGAGLVADLGDLARAAGSARAQEHARLANAHPPLLRTHDRTGERVDRVDFHPSYHWLLEQATRYGLHAAPWCEVGPHAHLRRAAGFHLWSQLEPGHGCPVSMTYAAVPALRADPALASIWEPRLAARAYDPSHRPGADKAGALAGMGMTERQGGSDVRTNTTRATAVDDAGGYVLHGAKWFMSAPMGDVFLVLAQAPDGLTCFLVERLAVDGGPSAFRIERLKDKLGNRSNASAEVTFDGTHARRLGEEGHGVRTIIEMVAATRLDCVLGSAALVRRAVAEAAWHATHRSAFGRRLADQPLMQVVLADLAVEAEAATALGMRLAAARDAGEDDLLRIALPAAKLEVCKRTPAAVAEALECLGGNGYVEESVLPLLFRESPLNSIWEGSGNVNALDVLRALRTAPDSVEAWQAEVEPAADAEPRLRTAVTAVLDLIRRAEDLELRARTLASLLARCLQAALLVEHAPPAVADAFCASRLGVGEPGGVAGTSGMHGTLPPRLDVVALVARATPPG